MCSFDNDVLSWGSTIILDDIIWVLTRVSGRVQPHGAEQFANGSQGVLAGGTRFVRVCQESVLKTSHRESVATRINTSQCRHRSDASTL